MTTEEQGEKTQRNWNTKAGREVWTHNTTARACSEVEMTFLIAKGLLSAPILWIERWRRWEECDLGEFGSTCIGVKTILKAVGWKLVSYWARNSYFNCDSLLGQQSDKQNVYGMGNRPMILGKAKRNKILIPKSMWNINDKQTKW